MRFVTTACNPRPGVAYKPVSTFGCRRAPAMVLEGYDVRDTGFRDYACMLVCVRGSAADRSMRFEEMTGA
jgi:hypothetical protein